MVIYLILFIVRFFSLCDIPQHVLSKCYKTLYAILSVL